jgi:long-subunit fatty acid transport protein
MRAAQRLLFGLVLLCWTTTHSAKELQASPMEDSSLGGTPFTGPTHGHPSSFYVNPAALGLTGNGWHLHLGASGRLSSVWIERQNVQLDQGLSPGAKVSTHTLSPGGIAAWYGSFREGAARFGASLFAPSVERFPSGESALGYHSAGGELVQGMLTMAGSLRFAGRFYVGLGFSLGYTSLRLNFDRDSVLSGGSSSVTGTNSDCAGSPCGYENPEARETYKIRVGTEAALNELIALKNVAASVGLVYELPRKAYIGFGYLALPGSFRSLSLSGDATVRSSPREGGEKEEVLAEVGFKMSQMVYLGYRRPFMDKYDLVTDIRWQDWSRHSQFDIRLFGGEIGPSTPEWMLRNRGFHDVYRLSAGVESNDRQAYRYGARLRYETSAVPTNRVTPAQVAGSNLTLAAASELRLADHWVFTLGYEISWFPTMNATDNLFDPRLQVDCVDSGYSFDECAASRQGRDFSTAAGTYDRLQHGAVVSLRYDSL